MISEREVFAQSGRQAVERIGFDPLHLKLVNFEKGLGSFRHAVVGQQLANRLWVEFFDLGAGGKPGFYGGGSAKHNQSDIKHKQSNGTIRVN